MTQRERFRRCLDFERGVRPPNTEPGPLLSTWERWRGEGLPPELTPYDYDAWCAAFGLDPWPLQVSYAPPKTPLFEETVLSETETTVTKRMSDGSIQEQKKGPLTTIPHELRPAVTTRAEWDRLKEWLDVDAPLPATPAPELAAVFEKARTAERPVVLGAGSLVGTARSWLGFVPFATLPYDDPEWLEDLLETACRSAERQVRLFGEHRVPVDVVHFWEDICFKNGPIMNPAHFRERVTPRYRRVADLAARCGYAHVEVDSDGDIRALVEPWMEGGVTVLCPLEVQAGMDVNALQAQYGRRMRWTGGVHKSRPAGGARASAAELRRVEPAVEFGGYVPMLDHGVPAEVSLRDYLEYLRLKHEILGIGSGRIPLRA
jgi:uroporphyrinogen decarboxylase